MCALCSSPEAPLGGRVGGAHGAVRFSSLWHLKRHCRSPRPSVHVLGLADFLHSSRGLGECLLRQSNGQTERINQSLESTLRGVAARHPTAWSSCLPLVQYVHNTLVSVASGLLHSGPWLPIHCSSHTKRRRRLSRRRECTSVAAGESGFRCMLPSSTLLYCRSIRQTAVGPWAPSTAQDRRSGYPPRTCHSRLPRGSWRRAL